MVYSETQSTGRLRSKEYRVTSLSSSDFLLAATIVCLDLYYGLQLQNAGRPSGDTYTWGRERREEMLAAIRRSKEIWDDLRDETMEAWKGSGALGVMLSKMNLGFQSAETKSVAPTFEPQDEKRNAAMTLGLLSSGMTPVNAGPSAFGDPMVKMADSPLGQGGMGMTADAPGASPFSNMFGAMPDMQLNLDWVSYTKPMRHKHLTASGRLGFVHPEPDDRRVEPMVADDGYAAAATATDTDSPLLDAASSCPRRQSRRR